ncbi:MAG: beta-ketoacyl synthase [Verrucomicrobiia bacterium]
MLFPPASMPETPRRVVVTGGGIVTSLGAGWRANAKGFRMGRRAFQKVTLFDVSRNRAQIAAQVDERAISELPATLLSSRRISRLDRAAKFLLCAAHEALRQARWTPDEKTPLVLGTTSGGMGTGEGYLTQALTKPCSQRMQPTRLFSYQSQCQAQDLCDAVGIHGPITIIGNACSSGANAIGHAWELVRSGRAARVLAGGYDGLCRLIFSGFDSLNLLSPTPCLPFDAHRSGLSLGEGAGMLTLESLEHAQQRGAGIIGEVIGYSSVTDIHHLTQPDPQGSAVVECMRSACQIAGIGSSDVDYVNAHGTATLQNDSTEAIAINQWAGNRSKPLYVSSSKASVGHLMGGAGAVEALVCLMVTQEGWLPPETGVTEVDPLCRFQIVRRPMDLSVSVALSNSIGFGGASVSLLFRRWS